MGRYYLQELIFNIPIPCLYCRHFPTNTVSQYFPDMPIFSYLYFEINLSIIIIQLGKEDYIPYGDCWHHCSLVDLDSNIWTDLARFQLPLHFSLIVTYWALIFIFHSNTRQIHSLDVNGPTVQQITNELVIYFSKLAMMSISTQRRRPCY